VFGRVAGDSASSYLFSQLSNERASNRLNTVASHLLETRIRVDPSSKNVNLQFSWDDSGSSSSGGQVQQASGSMQSHESVPANSQPAQKGDKTLAQVEQEKLPDPKAKKEGKAGGEFSIDEVKKHNTEKDCWVIIDNQVLDVSK
jgi:hypothetical protein